MKAIDYRGDPRFELAHIGNRNSGRYRRGSGDRPYQHDERFRRNTSYIPYTGTSDLRIDTYGRNETTYPSGRIGYTPYTTTSTVSPYDFSNVRTYVPSTSGTTSNRRENREETRPSNDDRVSAGNYYGRSNKYVNADGTLTAAGEARYEYEKAKNNRKKKDDRVKNEKDLIDPFGWVREDYDSRATVIKESSNFVSELKKYKENKLKSKPAERRKRLDLSDMTDQELNAQINRYLLEQKYQDVFNPKMQPEISKGKKFLFNTLETVGVGLTLAGSAVQIAKALHDMKKG